MPKRWVGMITGAVVLCMAGQTLAADVVVNATTRGWFNSLGQNDGQFAGSNYLTGYCDLRTVLQTAITGTSSFSHCLNSANL